jgi:hypothetical protein
VGGGGGKNSRLGALYFIFTDIHPCKKKKHADSVLIGNSERQTALGRLIVTGRIVLQSILK